MNYSLRMGAISHLKIIRVEGKLSHKGVHKKELFIESLEGPVTIPRAGTPESIVKVKKEESVLGTTTISLLTQSHFSEIILIANSSLGEGYITLSELKSYIEDDSKDCLIAKTNGKISGFQLMKRCRLNDLNDLAHSQKNWFRSRYKNYSSFGVLKTLVVLPEKQKQGIGTMLTKKSLEILQESSKKIISICWENKGVTPVLALLQRCGMRPVCKFEAFWAKDSLAKNYHCMACGAPPCKCNAFVYET